LVGSGFTSAKVFTLEVKWTFISELRDSSRPRRSFGVRVQSSGSSLRIFVMSTGGCGGFFFSWRFIGTTGGGGSGSVPSLEATCAGGGFGLASGGGSGGIGPAVAA
jgi:hypothetical protein